MGDEHPLSDDGRGIVCPGLESAAPSLAGEGSGTIHLRGANTTAGLDQGQFRASANSHVARFGSFSEAARECGLLSQASRMVADLEAELGVILLSFPTTQEIVVQLRQLPRGCEGRGPSKDGRPSTPYGATPGVSPGQALLPNGRRNRVLPERRAALSLSTIIGSFVAC